MEAAECGFAFLLPTLAILFVYDVHLALVVLAVALFVLAVTTALGIAQIAPQRRRYEAARRLSGELLSFIIGMSKLRVAGAEASAFASWSRGYRAQHAAGIQISRRNEHLVSFSAALPALLGVALFAVVLARGPEHLALSDFLVVYAVSTVFFAAVIGLGRSIGAIAAVIPAYEQVKPILEALPESRREGVEPIVLGGEVHFDHIGFRYHTDGPPIVDDVSIHARPGEFVAIVGESGAGKSTLMRLALGLEEPSAGGVYYDGRDLAKLDRRSVRRQMGVVMQDGMLQPGTLLDNIIGVNEDLAIDDAWNAARRAAVGEGLGCRACGAWSPGDLSRPAAGHQHHERGRPRRGCGHDRLSGRGRDPGVRRAGTGRDAAPTPRDDRRTACREPSDVRRPPYHGHQGGRRTRTGR